MVLERLLKGKMSIIAVIDVRRDIEIKTFDFYRVYTSSAEFDYELSVSRHSHYYDLLQ